MIPEFGHSDHHYLENEPHVSLTEAADQILGQMDSMGRESLHYKCQILSVQYKQFEHVHDELFVSNKFSPILKWILLGAIFVLAAILVSYFVLKKDEALKEVEGA